VSATRSEIGSTAPRASGNPGNIPYALNGEAISSKARTAQAPVRRQVLSFSISLYEAEARPHGSRGALLKTNPLLETFFPPQ
jgi:hypothetical protein